MANIHGTCVDWLGAGILIVGPSGSGKSDLALRLIDAGAMLVADDQCVLSADEDLVFASPAPKLEGLLEVRGVGIIKMGDPIDRSGIELVVELVEHAQVERLPPMRSAKLEGVALPLLKLYPREASAVLKIKAALVALNQEGAAVSGFGVIEDEED